MHRRTEDDEGNANNFLVVLERIGHLQLHITRMGEEGCWKGAGDDKRLSTLTAMPSDYLTDLSLTEKKWRDFGRDRQEGQGEMPKERQSDVDREGTTSRCASPM